MKKGTDSSVPSRTLRFSRMSVRVDRVACLLFHASPDVFYNLQISNSRS
jgi:hypothetical protein